MVVRYIDAGAAAALRQRVSKLCTTDKCTAELDEAVVPAGSAILHVDEKVLATTIAAGSRAENVAGATAAFVGQQVATKSGTTRFRCAASVAARPAVVFVATGQHTGDTAKGVFAAAGHAAAALNAGIDLAGIGGALADVATTAAIVDITGQIAAVAAAAAGFGAGALVAIDALLTRFELAGAAEAVGVVATIAASGTGLPDWPAAAGFSLFHGAVGFKTAVSGHRLTTIRRERVANALQAEAGGRNGRRGRPRRTSRRRGGCRGRCAGRIDHTLVRRLVADLAGTQAFTVSAALLFPQADGSPISLLTAAWRVTKAAYGEIAELRRTGLIDPACQAAGG